MICNLMTLMEAESHQLNITAVLAQLSDVSNGTPVLTTTYFTTNNTFFLCRKINMLGVAAHTSPLVNSCPCHTALHIARHSTQCKAGKTTLGKEDNPRFACQLISHKLC